VSFHELAKIGNSRELTAGCEAKNIIFAWQGVILIIFAGTDKNKTNSSSSRVKSHFYPAGVF
jgi:hypothetical protein